MLGCNGTSQLTCGFYTLASLGSAGPLRGRLQTCSPSCSLCLDRCDLLLIPLTHPAHVHLAVGCGHYVSDLNFPSSSKIAICPVKSNSNVTSSSKCFLLPGLILPSSFSPTSTSLFIYFGWGFFCIVFTWRYSPHTRISTSLKCAASRSLVY